MNFDSYEFTSNETSFTEWSMARLPKEGEKVCGDYFLVKNAEDKILIGAIDGLGHGMPAAEASKKAVRFLESFNDESVITLVNRCHNHLLGTRGAVMSLGLIDTRAHTLTWIGVGNVEGVLIRSDPEKYQNPESIILRGGVVGYKLPSLQASIVPIVSGDTLIFTTDGVANNYVSNISANQSTDEIVKYIAKNYFKKTDDALILAVQFRDE